MKNFIEISFAKARYGRYEDTAENRRLHRVGQEYGKKDGKADSEDKLSKKEQRQERLKKYKAALDKLNKILNSSNLEENKRKQVGELRGKLENKIERLEARIGGSKSQSVKEQALASKPKEKEQAAQSKAKESKDGKSASQSPYSLIEKKFGRSVADVLNPILDRVRFYRVDEYGVMKDIDPAKDDISRKVGDSFYGKDDLAEMLVNIGGQIKEVQIRKRLSTGIGTMYREPSVGTLTVAIEGDENGKWYEFNVSTAKKREDFKEYLDYLVQSTNWMHPKGSDEALYDNVALGNDTSEASLERFKQNFVPEKLLGITIDTPKVVALKVAKDILSRFDTMTLNRNDVMMVRKHLSHIDNAGELETIPVRNTLINAYVEMKKQAVAEDAEHRFRQFVESPQGQALIDKYNKLVKEQGFDTENMSDEFYDKHPELFFRGTFITDFKKKYGKK